MKYTNKNQIQLHFSNITITGNVVSRREIPSNTRTQIIVLKKKTNIRITTIFTNMTVAKTIEIYKYYITQS